MKPPKTTMFGTVVEKGLFFKGYCVDNDTGYCALAFVMFVINNFLCTRLGWGRGLVWATLKTYGLKKLCRHLQMSLIIFVTVKDIRILQIHVSIHAWFHKVYIHANQY